MHEALTVNRGFQLLNTVHFNHQIRCVALQASESAAVHYTSGSEHVTATCSFKQHQPQNRFSVGEGISQLIYVKKCKLYVAFCPDLTLRVFSEQFVLLGTVNVTGTILSLAFNDATSELYSGGVGYITTWQLRHQLHNPLVAGKAIACSVAQQQWVVSLELDVCTEKLVATCQDAVYIIDTQARKQCDTFINGHKTSITSALLYAPLEYLVSAAKDGSIKVWNCLLHNEVHTFTGHLKAVTGLKVHPLSSCVVSCSLDGTVRSWHLESMTECYRLDCGEPLLGLSSDFPLGNKLVCHAHQTIRMWVVNQLEAHFASVNSNIVSMSRSGSGGSSQPARILTLAEDGGVRLLSPVNGQVISILFPMFSSQVLQEVVYSLPENLLFALLRTSEVLVFSSLTNPCSARQLWVPSGKDNINCLAVCTITVPNGLQSLVFGGQSCGHISLLYGCGVSMPHPCPAHAGHVTKLASSTNHIPPLSSTPALVSYGSDNMLNVWCVQIKTQVRLELLMTVSIEPCPTHMSLLHSTLCLALADNRTMMLNVPSKSGKDGRMLAPSQSLANLPLLIHQIEDDHTDKITSLSCTSHLNLFVTSSNDGRVKIWSLENQLVSEIHFGPTLTSVCFANPKGDLLVGLLQDISIVQGEDCLPAAYVKIARTYLHQDDKEELVPFDPGLEFWYDPSRVPSLPAQQDERKRLFVARESQASGLPAKASPLQYEREANMVASHTAHSNTPCEDAVIRVDTGKSLLVDSTLARQLSQQYFASLMQQSSSGVRGEQPGAATEQLSPTPSLGDYSGFIIRGQGDTASPHTSHGLDPLSPHTEFHETKPGASLHTLSSRSLTVAPPRAHVMPLQSSSCRLPIAPDCLIPNSILRSKLGYVPPKVIIPVQRPKAMKQKTSVVQLKDATKEVPQTKTDRVEPESFVAVETKETEEMVTDMSESAHVEKNPEDLAKCKVHAPSFWVAEKQTNHSARGEAVVVGSDDSVSPPGREGGGDVSSQREVTPKMAMLESQHTKELVQKETSQSGKSGHPPPTPHSSSNIVTPPRRNPSSELGHAAAPKPPSSSTTPTYILHEFSLPHDHSGHSTTRSSRIDVGTSGHSRTSRSGISITTTESRGNSKQSSREMFTTEPSAPTPDTPEPDNIELLLIKRISSQPWFPRDTNSPHLKAIIETLLSLLRTSRTPVFGKVCATLIELKHAGLLSDDQQLAAVKEVVARLESRSHSLKMAALKLLEQLGVGGREVILAILPLLMDPNLQIRHAAFSAVERLTGVVNRSQLHQLLIEMGLLQNVIADEDKIFSDLATRIQNGQVKPNLYSLLQNKGSTILKESQRENKKADGAPHSLATELPALRTKNRTSLTQKQHHTEKSPPRRVHLHPRSIEERTMQGREQVPQVVTPHVALKLKPNTRSSQSPSTNYLMHNYKYCTRHSHPAATLHSHYTVNNMSGSPGSKLQRLIAHHLTNFSQMKPSMKLMLQAYGGSSGSKGGEAVEDYAWSEVFPVTRQCSSHRRSVSLPAVLCPLLPSVKSGTQRQGRDGAVKLPKIAVNQVR